MTKVQLTSRSEEETIALGATVGRLLCAGDVVALRGELGAGKTRFVRGVAAGLGVDAGAVSSPTFVIINEYAGAEGVTLVHVDAHRLRGPDDLDSLGWDEATSGRAVVVVEWAERVGEALGEERLDVLIEHAAGMERRITMTGGGVWRARLGAIGTSESEVDGGVSSGDMADEGTSRGGRATGAASDAGKREAKTTHLCPSCGAEAAQDGPTFPFCSPRCRMADLGKWFSGDYVISRRIEERDLDEES